VQDSASGQSVVWLSESTRL